MNYELKKEAKNKSLEYEQLFRDPMNISIAYCPVNLNALRVSWCPSWITQSLHKTTIQTESSSKPVQILTLRYFDRTQAFKMRRHEFGIEQTNCRCRR